MLEYPIKEGLPMSISTTERIYHISELVFSFFTLSLCWFLGTLLGGIVLGWAPSTTAILSVLRDQIMRREKFAFPAFTKAYKANFKQSNQIGLIILLFTLIIFINRRNFDAQEETIFVILSSLTTVAGWIWGGITLYVFPLHVHYETTIKNAFVKSFSFLIFRPHYTFLIGVWTWAMFSFIFLVPGIALFFGISIFGYGLMAITYQMFRRNEEYLKRDDKTTHF
jgi:uncharacterized membrane protein YesL